MRSDHPISTPRPGTTQRRPIDQFSAPTGSDAHITVVGHSYGSTLTGIAAKQGLAADDVMFVGSPGVKTTTAAELGLPEGAQVWAARSQADPIAQVSPLDRQARSAVAGFNAGVDAAVGVDLPDVRLPESHGPDPSLSEFGANRFGVDPAGGHSDYFKPNSESISNIAKIVAGQGRVPPA
jgi:pimeloyl-ACP methyl ester carboxylesterase